MNRHLRRVDFFKESDFYSLLRQSSYYVRQKSKAVRLETSKHNEILAFIGMEIFDLNFSDHPTNNFNTNNETADLR